MNKNTEVFIGIDPGKSGALSVVSNDLRIVRFYDTAKLYSNSGSFSSIDPLLFNNVVKTIVYDYNVAACYCEESLIVRGNGIKTSRTIFDSRGVMRAVFSGYGINVQYINPASWKRSFGLLKQPKQASIDLASEISNHLFDSLFYREYRGRKIGLDGRAESFLIAIYGQSTKRNINENRNKKPGKKNPVK